MAKLAKSSVAKRTSPLEITPAYNAWDDLEGLGELITLIHTQLLLYTTFSSQQS
jgi:hypothetical protein